MAKYNKKKVVLSEKITIRVTRFEKRLLQKKADSRHTSLSNYIRISALNKQLPETINVSEEFAQEVRMLKNVLQNQMQRSANLFARKDPKFSEEIRKGVIEIQNFLKEKKL